MKKKSMFLAVTILLVVSVAFSQYFQSLFVNSRLIFKTGSTALFSPNSNLVMFGTGGVSLGDSATIAVGGRIADTSAFSTTTTLKAIYIPGATAADIYFIGKRRIQEVSTVAAIDTTALSYMAKTDSVVVYRSSGNVSGAKFSWIRAKIN